MGGIIEDIDTYDLILSPSFYPSNHSAIEDLAKSIDKKGLLHPILIRHAKNQEKYQIVAGNRRFIACKALGWRKIPCHLIELDDREAFELCLIENIQRRTMSSIEEAHAFKLYVSDFGWGGISELATKIGKSASYVDRRLRLLDLPESVLRKIEDSSLNTTIAEELVPMHDEKKQQNLADLICRKRLTVKCVRKMLHGKENSIYSINEEESTVKTTVEDISELDKRVQRSLDKSITVFKVAMSKMTDIIEGVEDNWIIYEALMQHRSILNTQVDLLIKQKKKIYASNY
jgi:ParB family chromosome partitioning protein